MQTTTGAPGATMFDTQSQGPRPPLQPGPANPAFAGLAGSNPLRAPQPAGGGGLVQALRSLFGGQQGMRAYAGGQGWQPGGGMGAGGFLRNLFGMGVGGGLFPATGAAAAVAPGQQPAMPAGNAYGNDGMFGWVNPGQQAYLNDIYKMKLRQMGQSPYTSGLYGGPTPTPFMPPTQGLMPGAGIQFPGFGASAPMQPNPYDAGMQSPGLMQALQALLGGSGTARF